MDKIIMDKYLLTVVIPTYNRAETLRTTLSFVIPQVLAHKDEVHIYISDNASTDNTKEVVKEIMSENPDVITYFCQEKNLTASPNFNDAVHRVNSEYVYLLSDDDIIVPECISFMLKCIKENVDIDYFYVNQYVASEEMDDVMLWHQNFGLSYLKIYETGGEMLQEHFDGPSCCSANLFKRELWVNASKYMKEDCPGYVWLSILLHGAVNVKTAYISYPMFVAKMPAVQRYSDNWPWYYVKGLCQLFQYLDEFHPGLYDAWIRHQQVESKRRFMMILCTMSRNKKLYRQRIADIKQHVKFPMARLVCNLSVSFLPHWFVMGPLYQVIRGCKVFELLKRKFK